MEKFPLSLIAVLTASALFAAGQLPAQADKATMNYVGQDRSDDKGSEPEGVAVGMVGDRRIAVLGLERMTALAVFDIT